MSLKRIGIENFRVFQTFTDFEIKPLTILIGPNNSGKSSFPKLLLLLKNGLGLLNFKEGKHNLEDFEKVLNWKNNKDELRINFNAILPFFREVTIDYFYNKGRVSRIIIKKDKVKLLEYSLKIEGPIEWAPWAGDNSIHERYSLNVEHLMDILYEGEFEIMHSYFNAGNFMEVWVNPNKTNYEFESFDGGMVKSSNIDKSNYRQNHSIEVEQNFLAGFAIKNEISKLKKDYLLFYLFINGVNKTEEFKHIIHKLQKKVFNNIKLDDAIDLEGFDLLSHFKHNIEYLFKEVQSEFLRYMKRAFIEYGKDNVEIEVSPLGQILFQEKWFDHDPYDEKTGQTILFQLGNYDFEFSKNFSQIDYLSPNRGNQRRVLQNESEVEIDKIVADYAARDNKNFDFIERAFNIMGLEGTLVPVRYENTISVLYLEQDNQRISLADLGFGFSQLIPIFLKIIMSKNLLIIEEPEANLHPDLQSKLADLLNLAIQSFPQKKFIIETHSEYLIRKLQYLTAKKELSSEESVIYYFNADKHVSRDEPKVKKIEITSTGNLTDTFGPGFYDEATRLKFDLMKLNKEQSN
ncbi:MAG: DUF3696 domain-containing protein [Bacteroidota bacterium]